MIYLFKMAFRNLGRNRRRSFFSALALAIGLALLLLMSAVIKGEMLGSMNSSIKLQSGHLQVSAKSYGTNQNSLAWEDLIENPESITAPIAALPDVSVATPRLLTGGIIASGNESAGVQIVGIDPLSPANAPYRDGVVSGAFLTADDREGILVGAELARKMGLQTGGSVNLLVNTSNGDLNEQSFTIRGLYSTKFPSYDQGTIFMPLAKAQAISGAGNRASIIFILLKDREKTDVVATAIQSPQYLVKTWTQMNEMLVQLEQLSSGYMVLLYMIVLAITATVIINTLIMSVFERTREIGILGAIGMKGRRIMGLFFAESSLLAVGGIAMGLALGGLLVFYATRYGFYIGNLGIRTMLLGEKIYAHLTLSDTISLTITAFIVTLLAALYPAVLAARLEPVDALHGGK
jgi:ABC-type lipoprotein release transport system permease subunit